jgi:acyl-[acyl carrier protein]--UDP-N-acetylglucosamine O-acyltransferase
MQISHFVYTQIYHDCLIIATVIRARILRWAGHLARVG